MTLILRPATTVDADALAGIYNPYVLDSCVTFETEPVAAVEMAQRIDETRAAGLPWWVAESDSEVVGYAYASKWKGRCAYRYAVESTIYLAHAACGQGIGRCLYTRLINEIAAAGMHTAIAGIAQPNAASVALHERLGFRKVAHFEQVGFKQGRWVDVGYWQRMLSDGTERSAADAVCRA